MLNVNVEVGLNIKKIVNMIKYESDNSGSWWELLLGWKWPHQGFTIGYDLVMPDE